MCRPDESDVVGDIPLRGRSGLSGDLGGDEEPCSACEARAVVDAAGRVVFCAECRARASEDVALVELGGNG